ncbi:MAG: glycoside hydrolase family 15 protein [Gemmatimonadales bacterium]
MAVLRTEHPAFGHPGIEPRWTRSAKEAVGTAYSASSLVWFTVSRGILNEVYYPTVDRPQIRDLQYLITDGATFFHDERRHLRGTREYLGAHALGVRITNTDPAGRYQIQKQIIADPHLPCILVHTRLEAEPQFRQRLKLFALLAPHLEGGGWGNSGYVAVQSGRETLVAKKGQTWLALGATIPFLRRSCGYVGRSDGWTDLADNYQLDWQFDSAENGNIALTGELDLTQSTEFVLGLAFGDSLHHALTTLSQSLGYPFSEHKRRFVRQWARACRKVEPLAGQSGDGGRLYQVSHSLLLAHEDKTYPGATIASLSIPWGAVKGDTDLGGYHLVWTRDMVNAATGLLASGNTDEPLRALIYLACSQRSDGGFYQNFWIDGEPYWQGVQLDEVAFPIVLAWRLREAKALRDFDPYPMVLRAAGYLIREGPATPQERWEENSGLSPATLAAIIAGLTCAAGFATDRGDQVTAQFIQEYADFLERHVEAWTVTTEGSLVPGFPRHFIRLCPTDPADPAPDEDPNRGLLPLANQPPNARCAFPAKDVVDAGFLELVRYGIRKAGDPLIEDSLHVVDAVLKVETPLGPCWHRYNHDGYGQQANGAPFEGWGKGRAWPLLTGERGHYELAAGRDVRPFIKAMEGFAGTTGLLPEQIWDEPDRPEFFMRLGHPTGSAMPLVWAHAEYIKLLRSARDGVVFDQIPAVVARYQRQCRRAPRPIDFWQFNHRLRAVRPGSTLRILARVPFRLHWTDNEWQEVHDSPSASTALGSTSVDIVVPADQVAPLKFTFFWTESGRWEGGDFAVAILG